MWFLLVSAAFAFDNGPYQQVLDTYVNDAGRVDYAGIKANHALDTYLASLVNAEEPSARADRMAFWINAYNALTLDLVADNFPLASIRDLDGGKVWETRKFRVAGRDVTLNTIENQIVRPLADVRVHAALNCASVGCPPLGKTALSGAQIESQLTTAAKRWVGTNGVVIDSVNKSVKLSQIFDWYGGDFTGGKSYVNIPGFDGKQEAILDFVSRYLPEEQSNFIKQGGYKLSFAEYDWAVNKQ